MSMDMRIWKKKDGTSIFVSDMDSKYIENCIGMLKKQIEDLKLKAGRNAIWYTDRKYGWIKIFEEELEIRKEKHAKDFAEKINKIISE